MKAGNGGNGGAGGSSGRGKDEPFKTENISYGTTRRETYSGGTVGKAGDGGSAGTIMINSESLYKGANNLKSYNGISGLSGARGRYGVGGIRVVDNEYVFVRALCANRANVAANLPFNEYYAEKESYNNQFKNILNGGSEKPWRFDGENDKAYNLADLCDKILNLSAEGYDDSETKYPTEEDGARWDGSNYAALLEEANPTEGQN